METITLLVIQTITSITGIFAARGLPIAKLLSALNKSGIDPRLLKLIVTAVIGGSIIWLIYDYWQRRQY